MDQRRKDKRIEFFLTQEFQRSLKQLDQVFKMNALASLPQQFLELDKYAVNPSLKVAEALSSINFLQEFDLSNIAKQHAMIYGNIIAQQEKLYKELNFNLTNNIASLAQALKGIEPAIASVARLPRIDLGILNEVYQQETLLEEVAEYDSTENIFENLYQFFKDKIAALPKGKITAQGILQLYLALIATLSFLYSYSQSKVDQQISENLSSIKSNQVETNKLLDDLNDLSQRVIPLIDDLAKSESEESIYIVIKESPIRSQASGKATILGRVYPNQPVKVIDEQKRWLYVEYFDFIKSIPKMGYIFKGNVEEFKN